MSIVILFATGMNACSAAVEEGTTRQPIESRTATSSAYTLLSQTGLYADPSKGALAPDVEAFEPNFKLWSDGAEKLRYVALPAGETIDTTDMDHWIFPVGTRFWKEFWVEGTRVETRMIERLGEGADDYFMAAFVWNDAQTDAKLATSGEQNIHGTSHDVPSQDDCHTCHDGERGRVLGFSALQLSRPARKKPGLDLGTLTARARLSAAPPPHTTYAPPGDGVTAAALGYLHANCGHCHSTDGSCAQSGLFMRLAVTDTTLEASSAFRTAVGQPALFGGNDPIPAALRIAPGDPNDSAVIQRMQAHDVNRMPYLGTELDDTAGIGAVSAWISTLQPR